MPKEIPFECKFIWGSRELEDAIKLVSNKIQAEKRIRVPISVITHKLGEDIMQGKIRVDINIVKYRNQRFIKLQGGKNYKL